MQKLRVVIVEDEAVILQTFSVHVKKMGHEVVGVAGDGMEAINVIQEAQPDLVMLDLNLPEKDGITVINEVCLPADIPCIIITGHYSLKIVDKANIPCVYGYLVKPVKASQIRAAIEIAWSRYTENKKNRKEADESKQALSNRIYIDRAKGMLMDNFGLKEHEAMQRLQKMAQDKQKKLVDIAQDVIKAQELLDL